MTLDGMPLVTLFFTSIYFKFAEVVTGIEAVRRLYDETGRKIDQNNFLLIFSKLRLKPGNKKI